MVQSCPVWPHERHWFLVYSLQNKWLDFNISAFPKLGGNVSIFSLSLFKVASLSPNELQQGVKMKREKKVWKGEFVEKSLSAPKSCNEKLKVCLFVCLGFILFCCFVAVCFLLFVVFSTPWRKFPFPKHPYCLSELTGTETVSQKCYEVQAIRRIWVWFLVGWFCCCFVLFWFCFSSEHLNLNIGNLWTVRINEGYKGCPAVSDQRFI